MDVIKAEIARKKRLLEENNLVTDKRRYFRPSELASRQREDYVRRCGLTTSSARDGSGHSTSGGQASSSTSTELDVEGDTSTHGRQPPRVDVVRRLRDRLQPALLFGENEWQAWRRLRRLEIIEPEITRGLRNDFQEAMEKVDRDYLDEVLGQNSAAAGDDQAAKHVDNDEPSLTWAEMEEAAQALDAKTSSDADNCQILLKFYKFLLAEWHRQIQSEPASERHSLRVKLALATYQQTQQYLKPLFRQLRSVSLSADILDALIEIAQYTLARNYIKASDAYLQMAIGNAAWPIGVTMVGIHARTGREKIHSRHVAHVLNDETQRKYIQALKRLMTKCQELFPTDPSRSVEYGGLTSVKKT